MRDEKNMMVNYITKSYISIKFKKTWRKWNLTYSYVYVTLLNESLILIGIYILSLKSFKRRNGYVRDESVQLVGGILIVVPPPAQSYTDSERHVPENKNNTALLVSNLLIYLFIWLMFIEDRGCFPMTQWDAVLHSVSTVLGC